MPNYKMVKSFEVPQESFFAETTTEHLKSLLKTGIVISGLVLALAAVAEAKREKPSFSYFRQGKCMISTDYKWVRAVPDFGMHDLVIRNVKGITSETGKGATCLAATEEVIADYSRRDDVNWNDIEGPGTNDPIIIAEAPFAVPIEVHPVS